VQQNNTIFGTTGGAVSAIVFTLNGRTDGTGGADHGGCDFTTGNAIEVDASSGNSARVTALFEAELQHTLPQIAQAMVGLGTRAPSLVCTPNSPATRFRTPGAPPVRGDGSRAGSPTMTRSTARPRPESADTASAERDHAAAAKASIPVS